MSCYTDTVLKLGSHYLSPTSAIPKVVYLDPKGSIFTIVHPIKVNSAVSAVKTTPEVNKEIGKTVLGRQGSTGQKRLGTSGLHTKAKRHHDTPKKF